MDGFLVSPGNHVELAARLKQLLQDETLRHSIGIAARSKICENFDNQKTIKSLIELFRVNGALSGGGPDDQQVCPNELAISDAREQEPIRQ